MSTAPVNPFAPLPLNVPYGNFQNISTIPPGWLFGGIGLAAAADLTYDTATPYQGAQSLVLGVAGATPPDAIFGGISVSVENSLLAVVIDPSSPGTGYKVGDQLLVDLAGGVSGEVQVAAVGTSGNINSLFVISPGSGYRVTTGVLALGGSGLGAKLNITQVSMPYPASPGQVFVLSLAMKCGPNNPVTYCAASLVFLDDEGNILESVIPCSVTTSLPIWQFFTIQGVAPPGTIGAQLQLSVTNYGTSFANGEFAAVSLGYVSSIAYYLSLVTSQYRNSPNFLTFLSTVLTPILTVAISASTMYYAFDLLQGAVGPQLDVLGQIIGQSRIVLGTTLDDNTYRILLQATVARNQWDGQIDSLYAIWQALFPGGRILVIDNMNMTVDIVLAGAFTGIIQSLILAGYIVPRPQGVQYIITFATLPIFGVDLDNAYIAGIDVGHIA